MKIPDLPTAEKLFANLTPRDVYAPFARAEDDLAKTENTLAQRRAELVDHERRVAALPARVQRGEVKASALSEAMRDRDACALQVPSAEVGLVKARERLAVETTNAAAAVQREIGRRAEQLERVAAEIAPVLAELRELSCALALKANLLAVGGFVTVSWPCDAACSANQRAHMFSSTPAVPMLAMSGSNNPRGDS